MKKIILPTDFSETAQNAFRYAQQFAAYLGQSRIEVVHVFMPQVESEYPNFAPPITEFMKIREEMLDRFIEEQRLPDLPDLEIAKELLVGFAAEEINRKAAKEDLIIMGTTGQSGVINRLFGSVSTAVTKGANCPVILVPGSVAFQPFHHILYASNYESADDDMLEDLMDFNRPFNANIHFVHVRTSGRDDFQKTKEQIFEELFEKGEPSFAFEIEEVAGESVTEGLNAYTRNHPVDLVVMVNCRHSFWTSIFDKSQTRDMVLHTQQPLMVLHLEED